MDNIYLKNRNFYQKRLSVYRKQRNKLSNKIRECMRVIRNMQRKEAPIKKLIKDVQEFTGANLKKDNNVHAKQIYFKYGLENGLKGSELAVYINMSANTKYPSRMRKKFNKTLEENSENKQIWQNFKEYVGTTQNNR